MMGAPISAYAGLGEVGEQQRMLGQAGLDAEMGKYEYESLKDRTNLQDYMANISGEYGGTTRAPSLIQSLLGGII
jgi:hypothetical protein